MSAATLVASLGGAVNDAWSQGTRGAGEPTSHGRWLPQRDSHCIEHDASRRQNAQCGKGSRHEHRGPVYEDLEFAVRRTDDFDVCLQLASHARRHTDGMQSCDSVGAGSNLDLGHCRSDTGIDANSEIRDSAAARIRSPTGAQSVYVTSAHEW